MGYYAGTLNQDELRNYFILKLKKNKIKNIYLPHFIAKSFLSIKNFVQNRYSKFFSRYSELIPFFSKRYFKNELIAKLTQFLSECFNNFKSFGQLDYRTKHLSFFFFFFDDLIIFSVFHNF